MNERGESEEDLRVGIHPTNSPSPNGVVHAGRKAVVSRLRLVAGTGVKRRSAGHESNRWSARSRREDIQIQSKWEKGKKESLTGNFDLRWHKYRLRRSFR
jgi:hypothetical protein